MSVKNFENAHLERAIHCNACKWAGVTGELIAGSKPGLRCPKCDSPDLGYFIADAPDRLQ